MRSAQAGRLLPSLGHGHIRTIPTSWHSSLLRMHRSVSRHIGDELHGGTGKSTDYFRPRHAKKLSLLSFVLPLFLSSYSICTADHKINILYVGRLGYSRGPAAGCILYHVTAFCEDSRVYGYSVLPCPESRLNQVVRREACYEWLNQLSRCLLRLHISSFDFA